MVERKVRFRCWRLDRDRRLEAVKKERRLNLRPRLEMFRRDESVDDEDEELDAGRARTVADDGMAAAAANCSLECRFSSRRRRELSGLLRRGSRIILTD